MKNNKRHFLVTFTNDRNSDWLPSEQDMDWALDSSGCLDKSNDFYCKEIKDPQITESKLFLLNNIMKMYNLTEEDLSDTNILKEKIRDFKLNSIL